MGRAAAVIAAAMLVVIPASRAVAQGAAPVQPTAPGKPRVVPRAEMATPAEAVDAFSMVEGWVARWQPPEPGASGALAPAGAACVTLRIDGGFLARAASDSRAAGGALVAAARGAMSIAEKKLPLTTDAFRQDRLRDSAKRMTIGLELAGPLIPLEIKTYDEADAAVKLGGEGVAARIADRIELIFPLQMVEQNMLPGDALANAVAKAADDPTLALRASPIDQPGDLASRMGATFFRFKVQQLVQTRPGAAPQFTTRAGRLIMSEAVTISGIGAWADSMAAHLVAKARRVEAGAPGRDGWSQASLLDRLVVAEALRMYAALTREGEPSVTARDAAEVAEQIVSQVRGSIDARELGWVETALIADLSGMLTAPAAEGGGVLAERAAALAAIDAGAIAKLPPAQRALVAWVLAKQGESGGEMHAAARRILGALYQETPPSQLSSLMPWAGLAELAVRGEMPAAAGLRQWRAETWQHQLSAQAAGDEQADLAGGIVFTSLRAPWPTAQTARAFAVGAAMLGDGRVTDEAEVPAELSRLLAATRFMMQLTADEVWAWDAADAKTVVGGVRSSLWESRQPPEATAMSLIGAVRLLESLDALAKAHGRP